MRETAAAGRVPGAGPAAVAPAHPHEALLLVPVGSVEQHGPHLPLATDTMIATAVTRAVAELLDATGPRCWSRRR